MTPFGSTFSIGISPGRFDGLNGTIENAVANVLNANFLIDASSESNFIGCTCKEDSGADQEIFNSAARNPDFC